MLKFARWLRHGPLRGWSPLWTLLGRFYRFLIGVTGTKSPASLHIGPYGPFKFDAKFAFSDFSSFGTGKNSGLAPCVNAATGARCVLDIGAHIGLVSLPVCGVLAPGGRLCAFEPGDINRAFLSRQMELNGIKNANVLGHVVSDECLAEVEFFVQKGDSSMNSLAVRNGRGGYESVVKQQISLDRFCDDKGLSPGVMKIDVEGAEIKVLRGARETIRKNKPVMFLSVHKKEIAELGGSLEELLALIHDLDYEIFDFDNNIVHALKTNEYLVSPRPAN